MPAAAIIGSALIGGGLSYLGSRAQSKAAGKAAEAQANAANNAADVQWKMFQTNRADTAPWMDAGKQSLNYLASLMRPDGTLTQTFDGSKFVKDPGYGFRLNQGSDAIKKLAASKGQFFSGGMGRALDEYNQDFASNEYANAANAAGSYTMSAGNDMARGYLNAADATASGYSGMANAIGGGVKNYLYYSLNQ